MRGTASLLVCGFAVCAAALAQEYPTRPIRFVVPNTPGSTPDVVARIVAPEMAKFLGQAVVVENRPGAGQVIGFEYVAKQAPADGYTLASVTMESLAILPATVKELRFDPLRDLPPVIGLVEGRLVLVSSARHPWKTFADLVAQAKANPGKLNYGSSSALVRINSEALIRGAGLDIVHVPFAAAGPFFQSTVTGDVHMGLISEVGALSLGDKIRVLAVTGRQRSAANRDVPTFSELGHPQIYGLTYTLNVRAGTPSNAIAKLQAAASHALRQPEVKAPYEKVRLDTIELSGAAAAKQLQDQVQLYSDIAKRIGLQPE